MVIVRVHMIAGRSSAQKRALIEQLSHVASSVTQVPLESVRVVLIEVAQDGWGIGDRPFNEVKR